jgi:hypothetical protein
MRLPAGLAVLALAAAVLAPAGNGRSGSTLVIRVKSVLVAHSFKDAPPKGLSRGDVAVEHDDLFNTSSQFGKPAHALVGTDRATLTFLSKTSILVKGTARFPGGTVAFGGIAKETAATVSLSLPVRGGTGRYAHAGGTVTAGGSATNVNTYRLTLP